ncbi:aldo/keto reductase [Uliginosibacterium sp. H3]|uniref:Aldo/keto reductase n=1 Tax=Uliginosibacterium silvisoli TaxID=3114758 RepID=A0ABU6K4H1_9RHOO|nr:aldo/keto reductase [Uliginosibacterium sp. H3]
MSSPSQFRRIAGRSVSAIGLGCMNLSHAYGVPPPEADAQRLLLRALNLGVTLFDTAALYGFGANEELVGRTLATHRQRFFLASKCGMQGVNGTRVIDGRAATIKATCEDSLRRLRTDHIDLYYLHRWDKNVPIEESVGAMADLVREGKIGSIGLSEVSSATLRRAHAVHPVAALQSEYSLWSREPELGPLQTCRELGVAFVAFSPLGRGFLGGTLQEVASLDAKDIRKTMPRFAPEAYASNLRMLSAAREIAHEARCTMAQLALAWLLARGDDIIPIPGTVQIAHLEDDLGAGRVTLDAGQVARLEAAFAREHIVGARYNAASLAEVDSEAYPA